MNIMVAIKVVSSNFFKLKSKTGLHYSIKNDRFNIAICQSWAYVLGAQLGSRCFFFHENATLL